MGVVASKSSRVIDEMFISAAETLTKMVSVSDLAKGRLYPPLTKIRDISCKIAINVANAAFDNHIARIPYPENLEEYVRDTMFQPVYPSYL